MASAPQGEARLAGLDHELRSLRMRLEAVRRGIVVDEPGASAKRGSSVSGFGRDARGKAAAPAAAFGGLPVASGSLAEEAAESFGDAEVLARLRGLLDELRTVTGESP